jgi:hypothetical protein
MLKPTLVGRFADPTPVQIGSDTLADFHDPLRRRTISDGCIELGNDNTDKPRWHLVVHRFGTTGIREGRIVSEDTRLLVSDGNVSRTSIAVTYASMRARCPL